MAIAQTTSTKNVDQLNSFLRGEISAVETYRIALQKLDPASPLRGPLEACQMSHTQRVIALQEKIKALGGSPSESSGPWGTLTKAIETGAAALGDKVAVAALEEGEDHGVRDYSVDLNSLDGDSRRLVTTVLIPRQAETHRTLSDLKRRLATA